MSHDINGHRFVHRRLLGVGARAFALAGRRWMDGPLRLGCHKFGGLNFLSVRPKGVWGFQPAIQIFGVPSPVLASTEFGDG